GALTRGLHEVQDLLFIWHAEVMEEAIFLIPVVSLIVLLATGIGYKFRLTVDAVARPWLPAESLTLANNSSPRTVGYVLSSDGTWTVIMKESDRRLEIVRTSDVASRVPCRVGPDLGRPLIPLRKAARRQPPEGAC